MFSKKVYPQTFELFVHCYRNEISKPLSKYFEVTQWCGNEKRKKKAPSKEWRIIKCVKLHFEISKIELSNRQNKKRNGINKSLLIAVHRTTEGSKEEKAKDFRTLAISFCQNKTKSVCLHACRQYECVLGCCLLYSKQKILYVF